MPDALLHIGFNKCGSTALQAWLAARAEALLKRGVLYTRTDPRPDVICAQPQYIVLAHTLADRPMPALPINGVLGIGEGDRASQDRVADAFRARIETRVAAGGFDTWVGSSESLVTRGLPTDVLAALHRWMAGLFARVRYVAYIRRPAPWLISLYGHEKRSRNLPLDLDDFAHRFPRAPFAQVLRHWLKAVGPEALDVRLFREAWLSGAGLVRDFAGLLPAAARGVPLQTGRLNTSYASWRDAPRAWLRPGRRKTTAQRPTLSPETADLVTRENGEGLRWIEDTFFAADRTGFRAWAAGEA